MTMQNLVAISHAVFSHVRGPKNLENAGASPPWDGGRDDPIKTFLPNLSYHTNFGHPV